MAEVGTSSWPEKDCAKCKRRIRLVRSRHGDWIAYEIDEFVIHHCDVLDGAQSGYGAKSSSWDKCKKGPQLIKPDPLGVQPPRGLSKYKLGKNK